MERYNPLTGLHIFVIRALLAVVFSVVATRMFFGKVDPLNIAGLAIILLGLAYFAEHPHERALHAAATLEVDTEARVSVQNVIHRHYLDVMRPLIHDAQARGDLRADADTGALMSLLLMIFPHLALAPYVRGLDPILGLDEPTPEQPVLAVRRLVAVLAAAFAVVPQPHPHQTKESIR